MWIRSLSREVWVNMNHITHFSIELSNDPKNIPYDVGVYLDTSHKGLNPREHESVEGQAVLPSEI